MPLIAVTAHAIVNEIEIAIVSSFMRVVIVQGETVLRTLKRAVVKIDAALSGAMTPAMLRSPEAVVAENLSRDDR